MIKEPRTADEGRTTLESSRWENNRFVRTLLYAAKNPRLTLFKGMCAIIC